MLGNAVFSLSSTQAEEARILEEKNKHEQIQHFLTERATPDSIVPESIPLQNDPPENPESFSIAESLGWRRVVWRGSRVETNQASQVDEILYCLERWELKTLRRQKGGSGAESTTAVVATPAVAAWSGDCAC